MIALLWALRLLTIWFLVEKPRDRRFFAKPIRDRHSQSHMTTPTVRGFLSRTKNQRDFALPLIVITFLLGVLVLAQIFLGSYNWSFYCLAGLVLWYVFTTSKNPKRFLLILLILSIQVNVDFHLIHRQVNHAGPGGIAISATFLIILAILAICTFELVTKKSKTAFIIPDSTVPLLFLICAGILSMINTQDKFLSVCGIFQYIKLFSAYFVIANLIKNKRDVKLVVIFLLVCLLMQSFLYLIENVVGATFDPLGKTIVKGYGRYGGTFSSTANMMGTFFSSTLLLAITLLVSKIEYQLKLLAGSAFIMGVSALLLSGSRSPWIGFAAGTIILFWFGLRNKWLRLRTFIFVLGTVVIFTVTFWDRISMRLSTLEASYEERMDLNKIAWNMIKSHPVIGIGLGNYDDVKRSYITQDLKHIIWVYAVHNQYLLVWAETGTIGLAAFLWFFLATLRNGIYSLQSKDLLLAQLSLGMTLALVSILWDMASGIFAGEQPGYLIWCLAGLITATHRIAYSAPACKENHFEHVKHSARTCDMLMNSSNRR